MTDTTKAQSERHAAALPFTAKQALAMRDTQWDEAIATLTAKQQVMLASEILNRLHHQTDLTRFRALCRAAANKQEGQ